MASAAELLNTAHGQAATDTLIRTENPAAGKYVKLEGLLHSGQFFEGWGWSPVDGFSSGANGCSFSSEAGLKVTASGETHGFAMTDLKVVEGEMGTSERYWSVWLVTESGKQTGYRARLEPTASTKAKLWLEKVVAGTPTVLQSKGEVTINGVANETANGSLAIVIGGGKVRAFYTKGSNFADNEIQVEDSSFTSGFAAFSGIGFQPAHSQLRKGTFVMAPEQVGLPKWAYSDILRV